MDGKKFDQLTKSLATGLSRRQMIKAAAGGALGALTGVLGSKQLSDAAPKPGCVSFHTTGQGCNDPPGNNCCATDLCIGDNINNPGAGHCGSCPAGTTFCPNPNHPGFCCDNSTQVCTANDCCTKTACPANVVCGSFSDGCGGTQDCGSCTNTADQCHETTTCSNGQCVTLPKPDGTACSDGNACTVGDTCQAGVCQPGPAVVCTAQDQCHVAGTCDPATGVCSNPNKTDGVSCNDDNACTVGDTCQEGVCTGGTPVVCTASDQCHDAGTCDPATGICSDPAKVDGTACSDGNACTVGDTCQAGVCQSGSAVVCTAQDQCHVAGECDPATGSCSNPAKPDGAECDDGNECTQTDTCISGVCIGGNPVVCTASDQCHSVGVCDTGTGLCSNPAKVDGTACGDNNACTQTDICISGACIGTAPVECPPPDQCHESGICNEETGECEYQAKADGTTCDDGDACTQTDTCQAGSCVGSNPVICSALDQCHDAGICNPATGICTDPAKADGTTCDDGNACTQTDTCQAGVCTGGNNVICTALDQCHVAGTCNAATGACSNPPIADGTTCDDGNPCTQTDTCIGGSCTGGNPIVCTALDQCHVAGECDATTGECSNPDAVNGVGCDDENACTQTDTCQAGVCTGGNDVVCSALDQCHDVGTCDPATGECSNPNAADGTGCDDGNACTQTDTCQGGSCVGGNDVVCTALDQCHVAGTCDPGTGTCSNPAAGNGTPCDDGNACTTGDTCQEGICVGGPSPCNAANCLTCQGGSCVSTCPAGTHCDGSGNCVPDTRGCTSSKDCPGPGKCCCFNSKSQKGTCSDITGCGNGKNITCLPT